MSGRCFHEVPGQARDVQSRNSNVAPDLIRGLKTGTFHA